MFRTSVLAAEIFATEKPAHDDGHSAFVLAGTDGARAKLLRRAPSGHPGPVDNSLQAKRE